MSERLRIARLAESDKVCPQAFGAPKFGFRFDFAKKLDVVSPAAAPGQRRQRRNGGFCAVELVDEHTEGDGAHIFASDQPEPGEL